MSSEIFGSDGDLDKLRDASYLSAVKKGYGVYKGCTLPVGFGDIMKKIEDFEVYDDDIWVSSFPKCGSHWCQEMIWCLCHNVEAAKKKTWSEYQFLEMECVATNFETGKCALQDYVIPGLVNSDTRPRFIKTHLPWDLLPKQIRTFEKRPKIVHVTRNCKDACVSFYHHQRLMDCYTGDFELFCRLFLKNKLFWTPFASNVLSYWTKRSEPNVFIVNYEDMKKDLTSIIKKTSEFLKVSVSDDKVAKMLDHLSFKSVKENKALNMDHMKAAFKAQNLLIDEDAQFIRKGVVGDYKTMMSPEIEAAFDDDIESVFNEAGLNFEFEIFE